ncbi:hypothetical protein ABT332_05625 [Saccharomonospora azurea]|uniref:hypothetical protein n=1 Tax=Saccharomonospora azurea TaxID=40988 RepID=UPI00332026F2
MSGGDYIDSTAHAATLSSAMDDFEKALTYRWRELVTEKIYALEHDYPVRIRRSMSPHNSEPMWEYWSAAAVHHMRGPQGGCAYVEWVRGGQEGSLGSVTCDGKTGATEEVDVVGPSGQMETVPPYIDCGMGKVLAQVEDWAWGEREHVYYQLPLFDTHDVGAIKKAHDDFIKVGKQLGLEAASGSADVGTFTPTSERELVATVEDLAGERGEGQDWWAGWTGLAASRAKAGFFASVAPTMNNQSGIVGSLANLYSARAAIIEKGRNDALYWIQWATKSLKEEEATSTNLVPGWKTVQALGTAISISGGWTGVGGAVGASVILVGFLGENLMGEVKQEGYKHEVVDVVEQLNTKIDALNDEITDLELDYSGVVGSLRTTMFGIHSYNLELYDLTQNDPQGDDEDEKDGYTAHVDDILKIGQACYEAGEAYAELLPTLSGTFEADASLADKDGSPTETDTLLIETRDRLEEFMKTSSARYLLAGDQVKKAAEAYAEAEEDQKAAFDRIMADWEDADVGDYQDDVDFDPEEAARETERTGFDPYEDHPARGGAEPGAGDGEEYETDKDS